MYIDWICNVYMHSVNIVNTECKYISIDNNIDIDISIDNSLTW